jgi:hypothetical protein
MCGMDRALSPYSPGAGVRPLILSGRDDEIELWRSTVRRAETGRHARGLIVHGLRGVGKTVLLGEMRQEAESRDWVVASLEANSEAGSFREQLTDRLYPAMRNLARPGIGRRLRKALSTFAAFTVKVDNEGSWTFGLDLDPSPPPSGNLELDLLTLVTDISEAMKERGTGVAVFIDEMQDLDNETLTALCAVAHQASQRSFPFLMCGAGLPSLPRVLSEAKSYSERLFEYRAIGALGRDDAKHALIDPATEEHVDWEQRAAELVLEASNGYPFFIQELGQSTWEAAAGPLLITHADAREGVSEGRRRLDVGFFLSRWERATRAERAYLTVMSKDGDGPSLTKDVADRLGRAITSLGPTRAGLIAKGLVFAPEHGRIAYTVPGMAEFIRRQQHD